MRVIGCLSWFEESAAWLAASVTAAAKFCDHIVAVDGAYYLYPESRGWSGSEQHVAILEVARAAGVGCTIHAPQEPWYGNEIEKRTFLFRAAELVAEPEVDWYFVFDGDDLVRHAPCDLTARLSASEHDAGEITLWWREDWQANERQAEVWRKANLAESWTTRMRSFFRAVPGIRVEGAHMVNVADRDGERIYLRGREDGAYALREAEDLTDFRVEHRHPFRPMARRNQAQAYYDLRDDLGIEETSTFSQDEAEQLARQFASRGG